MSAVSLDDNVLNRTLSPADPKFKIWRSAGLMLTYLCPSRCACCYINAGAERAPSESSMSVDLAVGCWRAVRRLAGEQGKIHITGGEPFTDYERLKKILHSGCEQRLGGLEKIETNAFWCTDEKLIRDRLQELRELGLTRLQISSDIYHQEYIPLDRVRLAARIGLEVLGPEGIRIRWRDFAKSPVLVANMNSSQRQEALIAALENRPERMLGRAAEELAPLLNSNNYNNFLHLNCLGALFGARHVHIDGSGRVFSGTCAGIIVGEVGPKEGEDLYNLWRNIDYRKHPILSILIEYGPFGLLEPAQNLGYRTLSGYADKCHMCYHIRKYLFERNAFETFLGPARCYGFTE